MKPTLQFRLSQHLTLTPQLQQSIRLLQLSTVELNQEIERILQDNPILERDEGEAESEGQATPAPGYGEAQTTATTETSTQAGEAPAEHSDDWQPDLAAQWRGADDDDDGDRTFVAPETPTLRDYLYGQLSLTNLGERDRTLVGLLIDALDEDGYLTQSLEDILALLPAEAEAGIDELGIALRHLQNFEPSGVGARNPAECLALQLR
ncbi:MAG TPA: RNA polymerase factor sigma-54, partial [Burkholderiales bacterium]|nr:RNA polymerase factor sigma-54 [Burkholderiales bacterium]